MLAILEEDAGLALCICAGVVAASRDMSVSPASLLLSGRLRVEEAGPHVS